MATSVTRFRGGWLGRVALPSGERCHLFIEVRGKWWIDPRDVHEFSCFRCGKLHVSETRAAAIDRVFSVPRFVIVTGVTCGSHFALRRIEEVAA